MCKTETRDGTLIEMREAEVAALRARVAELEATWRAALEELRERRMTAAARLLEGMGEPCGD